MHVQIHAHVCTCVERPEVVPTIFPFSGHVTVTLVLCTPYPHTADTNQINVKTLLFFFLKKKTKLREDFLFPQQPCTAASPISSSIQMNGGSLQK